MNVDKIKGMQLLFGNESSVSKVDPCGVCGERVGCKSIQCTKCQNCNHVYQKIFKDSKKFKRIRNYALKRNLYMCFFK